jgi:cobaltochelatase CobN
MHRLAAVPGAPPEDDGSFLFVEQASAPVVLLTSADTDLQAVATLLEAEPGLFSCPLRALNLAALGHPAVVDHYLATTLAKTKLVVVRLLGGRGHWSYGLESLGHWRVAQPGRQLLVLAGTAEEDRALATLGGGDGQLAMALAACLREGGATNLRAALRCWDALQQGSNPPPPAVVPAPDPLPHDWRDEPGARVGVIFYRALRQAGDLEPMEATLRALRAEGLAPRGLWVSSLRDAAVQEGVADLLGREAVAAVLCGTGFASVRFEEAGLGAPLWDRLAVPVLQILCSGRCRRLWQSSSIGLGPLDLSLQVALPELDGRITTRVGAFKEQASSSASLETAVLRSVPDPERLAWIARLTHGWIRLRQTPAAQRRIALVLANYPTRNSRLANGVGLDTPASAALMLQWLQEAGYRLREGLDSAEAPAPDGGEPLPQLPTDGDALIQALLKGRTNDPESAHRPPLDHLPLASYLHWYATLPQAGRKRLEQVWGEPQMDPTLEATAMGQAFPVRGLGFGHVVVVIQPERGYDRDPARLYHCPDLPPTHAYLAQYLWLRQKFGAHALVHVGKHGNLEWLPGKAVGLSDHCFPEWALGPLPHLYPFIVNDPGEGSQAKRRAQAVILDHLTPPLGRAGLQGDLGVLEARLDEYWEARQLGGERAEGLRLEIGRLLADLELDPAGLGGAGSPPAPIPDPANAAASDQAAEARLEAADGYLCELKEAQIRLGLHTFGTLPAPAKLAELLLCLARPPQEGQPGLTQALALDLGLELDPWADCEEDPLLHSDQLILARLEGNGDPGVLARLRRRGDGIALLEARALTLLEGCLEGAELGGDPLGPAAAKALERIRRRLMPNLLACGRAEKGAFLAGLAGERIAAGPSGAPTRGRPDLLPTGRNFYSVDLRGLPTEAAWDLGRRSAELLLDEHLLAEGDDLRHLALSVWGTATMRNGGEDIAQALALMGVRPVWDGPTRRLVEVEVIPLALLGRPRVDVTLRISGLFRDAFPQLVGWFNRACSLVAALQEPEGLNPLAAAARREGSSTRVYGSAPGAYGAGLQALIDSGHWDNRAELADAYLAWGSWSYGAPAEAEGGAAGALPGDGAFAGIEAQPDRQGLERRLQAVEVVLHNQDNREHDLLDSDDYYQFQGGLSAAVEKLRGTAPQLWFGDHSRHCRPRMHRLEKEFDKVIRSRLLNPRWIDAMASHGYKGGFEMAASLDYLFAYDASTGRVPDWSYGAIVERWLSDWAVIDFLRRCNPWALRDMAERLLEAHHRGLWEGASALQLEGLRNLVLESEALVEGHGNP